MDKFDIKQLLFYISLFILMIIGINYIFFSNDHKVEKEEIKTIEIKKEELIESNNIDEYKYIPEKEVVVITKTITKYIEKPNKTKEVIKKPIVHNIKVSDIDPYNIKTIDKNIVLRTVYDKDKQYKISLISSKKIVSTLPSSLYILLDGTIEKENTKSSFSLSFNEYYKDYTEYLSIEVKHQETNSSIQCSGLFLNAVSPEKRYNIQLDIMGDLLSCYIKSENDMPNIKKLLSTTAKPTELSKFKESKNISILRKP